MIGEMLAHYKVTAKIGEGGMGVVYRATDTRLGREVALKVLPDAFARDPERMARFRREAHVLASLNHPNIAAIYGMEDRAIVMELVEGETLSGPLPVETVVNYARQLTEALDAAHEKGVTHRDLKPANIKVTPEGVIKVLDFGLAKAAEETVAHTDPDLSPTMTIGATRAGVIMGTAAYMSPEQARGHPVDRRSDIWSLGVVLFELLTGKRMFGGETVSDTLAAVLKSEIDWKALPKDTPPAILRLLRRCLERDKKKRLRDVGEAWTDAGAPPRAARARIPWMVAGVAVAAALGLAGALWQAKRPVERPLIRTDVELGPDARLGLSSTAGVSAMLSPDGTRLAFVSQAPGNQIRLSTRRLDQVQTTHLAGTEGVTSFFFSPDGKWLGFFTQAKLKKVSVEGGESIDLCDAPRGRGGSWGEDGTIIASVNAIGGLYRIPSTGGTPQPLTFMSKDTSEDSHRWPQILPGGKAVLFTSGVGGSFDQFGNIEALSLETGKRKILAGGIYGRYLSNGYLVFAKGNSLFAAPMDLGRLELKAAPAPVLDEVSVNGFFGKAQVEVSRTGTLLYLKGGEFRNNNLIEWIDPSGTPKPLIGKPGNYTMPRFSPDGRKLALSSVQDGGESIWVYDLGRDVMTRLTFDRLSGRSPVWTPDGKGLLFSARGGIFHIPSDGSGAARPFVENTKVISPTSMHPNGKRLAYMELDLETGYDIWTVPIEWNQGLPRAGKPEPLLRSKFNEMHPAFSPDGRWLAYFSNESGSTGQGQVYVRPAPDAALAAGGGRWQISNIEGTLPVWSRNGRELFFETSDQQIMVVPYEVKGDSFLAGTPRPWTPRRTASVAIYGNYDVAPDGKRAAAVVTPLQQEKPRTQITFLQDFFDELRRRTRDSGGK